MELSANALKVLEARCLVKDENGLVIETPGEMFRRVAKAIGSAEGMYGGSPDQWEIRFYELMSSLRFLPNSPMLMNAGKDTGQLSACFVLPVDDSMRAIFDTLKNAALILQSGGGTGFSFSSLRPKSDIVRSTGGIASGPVSFMRMYNAATDIIRQGGARRGANMGILRVDHPDILDFIRLKRVQGELTNFNISVSVTDVFMEALKKKQEYELVNPRNKKVAGRIKAEEVFSEIVESAWATGDPGLIFIDRINRDNPTPHIGAIEAANPCGEQPLLPYEACVLGSMNLSMYVKPPETGSRKVKGRKIEERVDFDRLSKDIYTAVRFLDDSIDVNKYPLASIEAMHKANRKIGLGIMGWADMLVLLGLPYNHNEAFLFAKDIMRFIRDKAREASAGLAVERGVFPNYKGSIYDAPDMPCLRNATLTTIAPAGTLSIIADCSSGIEPLFSLAYKRLVLETGLPEVNRYFFDIARKQGFYSGELREEVLNRGCLRGIKGVPEGIRRIFKTAHEIPPEDHIEMAACFQLFTDNAVSKTINMPNRARREDVFRAFMLAYEKGCKGITVFRAGTKKAGALIKYTDENQHG